MKSYEILEEMKNYMTEEQILEELMMALTENEAKENLEHIIRSWDMPIDIQE